MDLFLKLNETITSSSVSASGQESAIISFVELVTLGLFFNGIKAASSIIGGTPKRVWFMEPTVHRVYYKYNYKQVRKITKTKSYKFLEMQTTPQTIAQTILENNDTVPAEITAYLQGNVINSIENSWSKPGPIYVATNLRSNIIISGGETFEFSSSFGKAVRKTKVQHFSSGVNYHLEASKNVEARMIVYETKATVQIEYETKLSGDVVAEYDPQFKGHYFYGAPVEKYLKQMGKQNSFITTETVKIDMFSKMRVKA